MAIAIDSMFIDRDWSNEVYRPDAFGAFIPGKRGRLFAQIYYPGGKGPHPLIIFCHGLPGNERLTDFAIMLRHIGFCTLIFHYSGSWGSDGDYSVGNSLEDVDAVMAYVLHNENGLFDLDNIFLNGHSLGGLVGAYALAKHEKIKAGCLIMPANISSLYLGAKKSPQLREQNRGIFDEFGKWLKGFSWNTFAQEAEANIDKFMLATYAEKLSEKPLLAIAGSLDTLLPRDEHIDMLTTAIKLRERGKLKELTVPTDHGLSDQRYTVIRAIAEFFNSYIC